MYTESNVKLSCNALWQKCVLATLYRAAATHPEIRRFVQQAVDHWPHLLAIHFTLHSTRVNIDDY
ncbi:TPA: hypothetical protein R8E86_003852 [Escherichia coli]|nr:hypothetical protein [Escherichia coli]